MRLLLLSASVFYFEKIISPLAEINTNIGKMQANNEITNKNIGKMQENNETTNKNTDKMQENNDGWAAWSL